MNEIKDDILNTALKHFLRSGIRKMSNDKLVALLGISTKTLYKYFKDKEDLLSQALDLFYSQQFQLLEKMSLSEKAPVLLFQVWLKGFEMEFNVNKEFFQDLHHYYPDLEAKVEQRNAKVIWGEFIKVIKRGIAEGDLRNDIIPEVTLEGMSILYVSIVRKRQLKKSGVSTVDLLLNTIGACLRGICTSKGIESLDAHMDQYKSVGKSVESKKAAKK